MLRCILSLQRLLDEKVIRTGKINCQDYYSLCRDVGVRSYPSLRFYEGRTHEGMSQVRPKSISSSKALLKLGLLLLSYKDFFQTIIRLLNNANKVSKLQ